MENTIKNHFVILLQKKKKKKKKKLVVNIFEKRKEKREKKKNTFSMTLYFLKSSTLTNAPFFNFPPDSDLPNATSTSRLCVCVRGGNKRKGDKQKKKRKKMEEKKRGETEFGHPSDPWLPQREEWTLPWSGQAEKKDN